MADQLRRSRRPESHFLEGEELTNEEIIAGIKAATIGMHIVPMTAGTAFKNKGVQAVLDAVIEFLPSPTDVPAIKGIDERENHVERHADDNEPFAPPKRDWMLRRFRLAPREPAGTRPERQREAGWRGGG